MKIASILVTHNRLELLKQSIERLRKQTRPLDAIFLIDNGSTDGTEEWATQQSGLCYIRQPNTGGAGGFFTGIKKAMEAGFDWMWCLDDDSLPYPQALELLVSSPHFENPKTGFLASLVVWTDGTPHRMNLPTPLPPAPLPSADWPIRQSSFVSLLVSRKIVEAVGLPLQEMVIWFDDAEYTSRISNQYLCYLCPGSIVVHATPTNSSPDMLYAAQRSPLKLRYGLRNRLFFQLSQVTRWRSVLRLIWINLSDAFVCGLRLRSPRLLFLLPWWTLQGVFFRPTPQFPDSKRSM